MARTRSDNPYAIKALRRGIPNVLTFLAALPTVAVRAQEPDKPASRVEATAIITNARKIVTPNGVERLEKVRIGRIEQWVSIRGADRRNPVLLLIHGGPGYVSMPMSWWLSRGWEEYFTKFAVPLILFDGHQRPDCELRGRRHVVRHGEEAPDKHLVWFEHSAHMPMTEEPGEFLLSLVHNARPIAEKAGDVGPRNSILVIQDSTKRCVHGRRWSVFLAQQFSYDLKVLKRATIVGEKTRRLPECHGGVLSARRSSLKIAPQQMDCRFVVLRGSPCRKDVPCWTNCGSRV